MENKDKQDFNEYPEDVKEDYLHLSTWINELLQKYSTRIRIELINVQSFRGFYKSVRYWTQHYPTFIVNKKEKYSGKDKSRLDFILQRHLARSRGVREWRSTRSSTR